jgi:GPI-anchor transamidase subunit GAA1
VLYPRQEQSSNTQRFIPASQNTKHKDKEPIVTPLTPLVALPAMPPLYTTTPALLKAFNLCVLGAVISVMAVANFSLSVSIAVLAALPLCLAPVSLHRASAEGQIDASPSGWMGLVKRISVGAWMAAISPMGVLGIALLASTYNGGTSEPVVQWTKRVLWEFVVLKTWFVPLVCNLYLPLVLQGLVICLLPV